MFNNISDFVSNIIHNAVPATNRMYDNIFDIQNNFNTATNNNSNKPPPASNKVLSSLPMVKITSDDLIEAANKECLICLEEQDVGKWACKLQCGHLYHKQCIHEWLSKNCTCPVCRFELETDDINYENKRKLRMKKRKIRLRLDEIQKKSINELKQLCLTLHVDIKDCIDKSEIVDRLVKSGYIDITLISPPVIMNSNEFYTKTVTELRYLLLSYGISDKECLEKSELRTKLLESGRIIIEPNDSDNSSNSSIYNQDDIGNNSKNKSNENNQDDCQMDYDNYASYSSSLPAVPSSDASSTAAVDETLIIKLQNMKLTELRSLCNQFSLNVNDCIEKREFVERLVRSGHMSNYKSYYSNSSSSGSSSSSSSSSKNQHDDVNMKDYADYTFVDTTSNIFNDDSRSNHDNKSSFDINNDTKNDNDIDMKRDRNDDNYIFADVKKSYNNINDDSSVYYHYDDSDDAVDIDTSNINNDNNYNDNNRSVSNKYVNSRDHSYSSSIYDKNYKTQNDNYHHKNSNDDSNDNSKLTLCMDILYEMSIKEIKSIMIAYSIDMNNCIEKSDMISRMKESKKVNIIQ